jgi:DNA-binding transcriptional LysR family regulator
MAWDDFRYFLALARAGSLSAAARRMRVDQSTVGRRLAALEAEAGARLFDHTPDGYVLTAAGESVLGDVERLEDGFLAVERRLAGGDARIEGVVRVSISETFANHFVVAHLDELRARHPGLTVELATSNAPVDLARREADLAVRLGPAPKQPNLVVRPLGAAGFALYGSRAYLASHGRPRLRGGLRGHRVVRYGGELAPVPMARFLEEHAREAEVVLLANSVATVHEAVVAGLGLGVLPCVLAGDGLERIGPLLGANPIWSVVHEDLVRAARVRAVLQFLSEVIGRERRRLERG